MSRGYSFVAAFWAWIAAVTLASCATFAYDWHDQIKLNYESGCKPTIGYEAILEHATGETRNETTRGCAFFAQFAEFLAAKGGPGAGLGLGSPHVNQPFDIPSNPFRGPNAPQQAYQHLKDFHGVDPNVASTRLHNLKAKAGLGAADDVAIGRTGDVYNAKTGEWLGTLTDKSLGN